MNPDDTHITPDPERPDPGRPGHDAPTEPQGAASPPPPRRLTRASDDRVLGGVAGGLGRYFGIDPIIPRILFAALIFAGGFGLLAYVAAWLFVPDEGTGQTAAQSNRLAAVAGVLVLVAAIAVFSGGFLFGAGEGLLFLALVAALGYAIWRAVGESAGGSVLGRLVLVAVLGLLAVAAMAAVTVGAALGGGTAIAIVVIVAGLLVAAGVASGSLRWLLVPAVLIAIPAGVVAAADIEFDGGIGEREYRPAGVTELQDGYRLGVGDLRVDLRGLDLPPGRTALDVRVGVGRALVLVDEDVCVTPSVGIGMGEATVLGRDSEGVDVRMDLRPEAAPGRPTLALDAEIGIGELEVVHSYTQIDEGHRPSFFDGGTGRDDDRLARACGTAG